jgi:hypothetical protein
LVAKMSDQLRQYNHDYSLIKSYKDTTEPWYLNSVAIFKSTHQLVLN